MKYVFSFLVIGVLSLSAMARATETDGRVERLTTVLNLTEEQSAQVESIMASKQIQMQKLMQQMAALRDETDTAIKAVLTEEQQEKFDALRDQHNGRRGPHQPPQF